MKRFRPRKGLLSVFFCLPFLFFLSCSSIPSNKTAAEFLYILPRDVSFYISLNTRNTKDLLKKVIKKLPFYSSDMDQLLDFTERIYLGAKTKGEERPVLFLILLGHYPVFINSMFGWNKEWEEMKGDLPYWRHKKSGLTAAAPESYIVIIAQKYIEDLLGSFRDGGNFSLSPAVLKEMDANDITLLFPFGLDELVTQNTGIGIPKKIFEEIWIGGRESNGKFNFSGVFNLAPDVSTDSFQKLLQFLMLAILRKNGTVSAGQRLGDMSFVVEGRMVKVSNFYLTRAEFESLLSSILGKGF